MGANTGDTIPFINSAREKIAEISKCNRLFFPRAAGMALFRKEEGNKPQDLDYRSRITGMSRTPIAEISRKPGGFFVAQRGG